MVWLYKIYIRNNKNKFIFNLIRYFSVIEQLIDFYSLRIKSDII